MLKRKDKDNVIKFHDRLFTDIGRHIDGTSFESVSAFVHHVMADIVSTGDLALGGDIPESEADLVRRRLEALGYIEPKGGAALIEVHGGLKEPVNRLVPSDRVERFIQEAKGLDAYTLSREDLPLVYRLGDGVLSPLDGPMNREDYERVLDEEILVRDGVEYAWTVPVAFRIPKEQAKGLKGGKRLALIDDKNDIVGIITVEEVYPFDRARYLQAMYGTDRTDHPGARMVLKDRREWLMGGKVEVLPERPDPLLSDVLLPAWKTREVLKNRRWEKIVACHTHAPLLRVHEYEMVLAMERLTRQGHFTGMVLNPFVSDGDGDDLPSGTRMKCYQELLDKRLLGKGDKDMALWKEVGYDINDQFILLGLDVKRFYAGPREAVMHAVYAQNLGCTQFIIGSGPGLDRFDDGASLYKESAVQEKFDRLKGRLKIDPISIGPVAYFKELGRVALVDEQKSHQRQPLIFPVGALKEAIERGKMPDPRLIRPEVARILKSDYERYKSSKATNITWHHSSINKEDREALNDHRGIVIWFTGLSASGKSSVAQHLETRLYERGVRTYVLDGDNIRHGLNHNLGFSPEDREENIRRIGHVAKLFADSGIVVMTAFISPYRGDRDRVRELLDPGNFLEVFVDCPVEICEQRDPKGLYKKARAGQIPEFTGISAPYEAPLKPEVHLDAGKLSIDGCADEVVRYLEGNKLISRM